MDSCGQHRCHAQGLVSFTSCARPLTPPRSSMALGLPGGPFTPCQAPRCLLKVELGADVQRLVDQLCLLPLVHVAEAGGGGGAGGAAGVGHTAVRDGAALRPAARKVEGTGKSGDKEVCTRRGCTLTSPRSSLPDIVMMTLTPSCTSTPTSSLSNSHNHLHDTRRSTPAFPPPFCTTQQHVPQSRPLASCCCVTHFMHDTRRGCTWK